MGKIKNLACLAILAGFSNTASAALLDFEDQNNLGVDLGGSMTWIGIGGGHLYTNDNFDDDQILFYSAETYVNSFQMNAAPYQGYTYDINRPIREIAISGLNAADTSIWNKTVDLTNYTDWADWLTIDVATAGITQLVFSATGNGGFWPSIDNMIINEQTSQVPVPAAAWLFGSGLIALFGMARTRQQRI